MLDNAVLKDINSRNVWFAPSVQGRAQVPGADCVNVFGLLRVGCGSSPAMMRSARVVPNKWFGQDARFRRQGLRHVDQLSRRGSRGNDTSDILMLALN